MRRVLSLLASLVLALLASATPALAAPSYPGDLEPKFVGWFDAAGQPVAAAKPGDTIVAHYTVTNTLSYAVRITGVDSELTGGACVHDFQRGDRSTDVAGQLPLTLQPGETSKNLIDVGFTLSSQSGCASSGPGWMGNVIGERYTAAPTPSVAVRTATVQVTETTTVTEAHHADPVPFIAIGAVAAVAVVAGAIVLIARGRKR